MSILYPRTFRVGSTANFLWAAPEPVDSISGVNLTIGGYSPTMAQVVGDVTISAGGINTDRTVLTASIAPSIPTDFLKFGDAFLITAENESFPVRVIRVDGAAILLANPLPVAAPITAAATLQFTTWVAAISGANVTAAVDYQGTEWSVAYTRELPGELAYAQGLVKVVRVVWQSGLTTARLVRMFPSLQNLSHRDSNFGGQIDAGFTRLAARIDTDVAAYTTSSGERATLNDVQSQNAALELVHAHVAAAYVYIERNDPDMFEHHFTQAFGQQSSVDLRRSTGLYADAMRPIWVDLDRDGAIDDGELETVTGPGPGFASAGFPTTPRVTVTRSR